MKHCQLSIESTTTGKVCLSPDGAISMLTVWIFALSGFLFEMTIIWPCWFESSSGHRGDWPQQAIAPGTGQMARREAVVPADGFSLL